MGIIASLCSSGSRGLAWPAAGLVTSQFRLLHDVAESEQFGLVLGGQFLGLTLVLQRQDSTVLRSLELLRFHESGLFGGQPCLCRVVNDVEGADIVLFILFCA